MKTHNDLNYNKLTLSMVQFKVSPEQVHSGVAHKLDFNPQTAVTKPTTNIKLRTKRICIILTFH